MFWWQMLQNPRIPLARTTGHPFAASDTPKGIQRVARSHLCGKLSSALERATKDCLPSRKCCMERSRGMSLLKLVWGSGVLGFFKVHLCAYKRMGILFRGPIAALRVVVRVR